MIDIAAARELVLQSARPKAAVRRGLLDTPGLVLAEDVCSDIDSPPHDKSLVDGYAVRSGDVTQPGTVLQVLGCVTAGEVPTIALSEGTAVQIMTGAPLPAGADAVVMVEHAVEERSGEAVRVQLDVERVPAEQHVMRRGSVMRQGSLVLPAGHVVRPVDVGLLAEIGCAEVPVIEPPSVAVLATGNELVSVSERPQPGQIRNSNGPLLIALARAVRAHVYNLGVAPDQRDALSESIRRGLRQDVLVLSGGVSAGLVDLVPGVLQELGVQQRFHKVHLKPGKPLWFGEYHQAGHRCLVFGLPGNPVGSLVCFALFVAPALARLGGHGAEQYAPQTARLATAFEHQSDRPTYHPAQAHWPAGDLPLVTPVAWRGSADQRAIVRANCLVLLPAGRYHFAQGHAVEVLPLWLATDPSGRLPSDSRQ